jgi:hypothetical protein
MMNTWDLDVLHLPCMVSKDSPVTQFVTRLYNAALLTECGQRDPCSSDLIFLVRRLAKDRAVSTPEHLADSLEKNTARPLPHVPG